MKPKRHDKAPRDKDETGLERLLRLKLIDRDQFVAGQRYGMLYRVANLSGPEALRSCLDDTPRGGGGGGLPMSDRDAQEWILTCRERLTQARGVLQNVTAMIAPLDLICGRQWRHTEMLPVQRERDEAVNSLRIALRQLHTHWCNLCR